MQLKTQTAHQIVEGGQGLLGLITRVTLHTAGPVWHCSALTARVLRRLVLPEGGGTGPGGD
jgi:hypothetical protein